MYLIANQTHWERNSNLKYGDEEMINNAGQKQNLVERMKRSQETLRTK